MRLTISIKFPLKDEIPIHYNYWLQSTIYHVMEGEIANLVHDQGFDGAGRTFRFFTFSKLLGHYELSKNKKFIRFPDGANWIISSPLNDILGSIVGGMLKQPTIRLGGINAEITGVQVSHPKIESEKIRVQTLSPVVAYSTLFRGDGSKYTVYLQPGEPEFRRIVAENLEKKLEGLKAWNLNSSGDSEKTSLPIGNAADNFYNHVKFKIRMLNQAKLNILEYKGGVIKGYSGMMEISGSSHLLQVAVDAGLGSKNSQGCGCLEVMGMRNK